MPGLGTFSSSMDRASFNPEELVFYPSRVRIKFSEEEKSDNLLKESLSRQLNISSKESLQCINEFVNKTRSSLKHSNYCKLEGLGYLMNDSENRIVLKDILWTFERSNVYLVG